MTSNEITERWLSDAAIELQSRVFEPNGLTVPTELRFRVGAVPGTKGTSRKTLGSYVPAGMCGDAVPQIYITPLTADAPTVLAVLVHECIHAIHPGAGHRGAFATSARKCGLAGPLTATHADNSLARVLAEIEADLGAYPHGAVDPNARTKQGTRQRKFVCPDGCEVIGRFSRTHADKAAHLCPLTGEFARLVEVTEGEGE